MQVLAAVLQADAVFNTIPNEWLRKDLDRLGVPEDVRFILPVVKTAAAIGLAGGARSPRLGRLTTAALVAYFVAALGAHARVNDDLLRYVPAVGMLGWSVAARRSFAASPADDRCG